MQTVTESAKRDVAWKNVANASERADLERRHPPKTYTTKVTCKLTAEQLEERIAELSQGRLEAEEMEAAKAAAAKKLKAHRDSLETLVDTICAGEEELDVEVRETHHWDVGAVRVVRVDTGELVSERAITAGERQEDLFGKDEILPFEDGFDLESEDEP